MTTDPLEIAQSAAPTWRHAIGCSVWLYDHEVIDPPCDCRLNDFRAALASTEAPECLNPKCHNGAVPVSGLGGDGFERCPVCSTEAPEPETDAQECGASWDSGADCPERRTARHACEREADHADAHSCPCGKSSAFALTFAASTEAPLLADVEADAETLRGRLGDVQEENRRLAGLLARCRQAMDEGYSCPRCGWLVDDPYPVPRWGPCDICADARDLLADIPRGEP